jgi:steroid delta-isomerase-like uncharacterized protein
MATQDLTKVAGEYVDAFNAADWQRFKATLAPDIVYEEAGTQRRIQGVEEYVQLCQGWKQAFPDATGTIMQALAGDNLVAQEVAWEGTHSGPLVGPAGTIPASGRRVVSPATLWITFQGDKVKEVHHHLDLMGLLQQIGALPQ